MLLRKGAPKCERRNTMISIQDQTYLHGNFLPLQMSKKVYKYPIEIVVLEWRELLATDRYIMSAYGIQLLQYEGSLCVVHLQTKYICVL